MTVLETLVAARELLSDPARWQKESWGYEYWPVAGAHGEEIVLHDDDCYCAVGAVAKVREMDPESAEVWALAEPLAAALAEWPADGVLDVNAVAQVTVFNDRKETVHEDVLALFDRAIAAERRAAA